MEPAKVQPGPISPSRILHPKYNLPGHTRSRRCMHWPRWRRHLHLLWNPGTHVRIPPPPLPRRGTRGGAHIRRPPFGVTTGARLPSAGRRTMTRSIASIGRQNSPLPSRSLCISSSGCCGGVVVGAGIRGLLGQEQRDVGSGGLDVGDVGGPEISMELDRGEGCGGAYGGNCGEGGCC